MWDHVKIVFFLKSFLRAASKTCYAISPLYTFVMFRQHVVHVISVCIYNYNIQLLMCSPITSIQFLLCFVRKK